MIREGIGGADKKPDTVSQETIIGTDDKKPGV
jgi:hypothetical protein